YQPQLILLDNFLPDGKGIDLIRHTISTNYTGRIIFITADNHMRKFKYNKIISIMACREFFQENNEEKLIMSDKFIHRGLFGKMNV
ncbi:hypothetical protein MJN85_29210, partial [Salmonella enterica subsp. enterica serovar Anatum]|nr:hypothetical protein [Salmonella enterica subsp. enterica serovar Anatum]